MVNGWSYGMENRIEDRVKGIRAIVEMRSQV
jgi:hypothetical protein